MHFVLNLQLSLIYSLPHRFKLEFADGRLLLGPGAKMHFVEREPIENDNDETGADVTTIAKCKGVQQKVNPLRRQHYMDAIYNRQYVRVCNKGFKIDPTTNRMHTYQLFKKSLGYPYYKRRVLSDSITTTALDL